MVLCEFNAVYVLRMQVKQMQYDRESNRLSLSGLKGHRLSLSLPRAAVMPLASLGRDACISDEAAAWLKATTGATSHNYLMGTGGSIDCVRRRRPS